MKIKVDKKRYIGEDSPCYIIMDVGANHNGDLEIAKKLIISAAESGADAIKFQTYTADKLYSKKTPQFSKDPTTPYEMIREYEHPREWLPILKEVAQENNIHFFSSPFDFEAVDLLEKIDVPLYKVASPEIVDLDLIDYIAKKRKPIIVSTGMANIEEIKDAVNIIIKNENNNIIILHCNTLYPPPIETINLRAMETLTKTFPYIIGFSDHTLGTHIALAAVSMGAKVIEKHFTLDRNQKGPDHNFAIEPSELKDLVIKIREIEKAMGDGIKKPHELELGENYDKARRSIIAKIDIPKDTIISRDMLIVKRPGYGIKPKFIKDLIGKKAKKNIKADEWITWEMI